MSIWLPIALIVLVALVWSWFRADPVAMADRAGRTGDLRAVLTALHRVRAASQPTEYHRVLKRLWYADHREAAIHLAKDLASRHRAAPIAQYWLRQFLENEPEMAREHLDEGFLAAFFDPTVAAKCGSHG